MSERNYFLVPFRQHHITKTSFRLKRIVLCAEKFAVTEQEGGSGRYVSAFGAPDHIRLSIATSEENLMRGCDRILAALG